MSTAMASMISSSLHPTPSRMDSTARRELRHIRAGDTGQVGNFPPELPLATLLPDQGGDGSVGFVLPGFERSANANPIGRIVDGAGDVNGDGVDDLIIGADAMPTDDGELAGLTFVVFGRAADAP
jgi:hypothetical protein